MSKIEKLDNNNIMEQISGYLTDIKILREYLYATINDFWELPKSTKTTKLFDIIDKIYFIEKNLKRLNEEAIIILSKYKMI